MDQSRYINTYIDVLVGQVNEYTISILQLKTQLRLANEMLQEKDHLIGDLQNRINAVQNNDSDVQKAKDQARHWEDSYHSMTNKIAHMDTLLNQVKDMKAMILEKDKIIENLKTPKKVINTKKKTVEKLETDDF